MKTKMYKKQVNERLTNLTNVKNVATFSTVIVNVTVNVIVI